jgi:2Fe-2S ferredoxin
MGVLHVEPGGFDIEVRSGETLMRAAERLGYYWPTVCHGQAICTACRVEVKDGTASLSPIAALEREALATTSGLWVYDGLDIRLACQAKLNGDAVVWKRGVRYSNNV